MYPRCLSLLMREDMLARYLLLVQRRKIPSDERDK